MTSHRTLRAAALLSALLALSSSPTNSPAAAGTESAPRTVRPVGRDGHVLNLDFETGDLRDWTQVSGNAFNGQIKGVELAIADAAENADHLVTPEDAIRVAMARQ